MLGLCTARVVAVCFQGLARLSGQVIRRFVRRSREISLVPPLLRASTDALISASHIMATKPVTTLSNVELQLCVTHTCAKVGS